MNLVKFFVLFNVILILQINLIAQNDTITLPSTEIIGNKEANILDEFLKTIDVIDAENIKNSPINNVNDILDYVKGIDLRERGNMGVQADISSRGGTFEQTIVMLNGIIMNNPQTGHYTLDLPIDPADIEKIIVLNGPLNRIYGANAFSGAINIITKPNKINNLRLSTAGGQYGWYSANGSLSFNSRKTINFISLGKMSSDGYFKNTDFDYDRVYIQSNAGFRKVTTQLEAGIGNKRAGANSFYSAKYPNQFEHTISAFLQGNIKYLSKKFNVSLLPYYRRHQDRFELFRDNQPLWYKGHNYHLTHVKGIKANAQFSGSYGTSNFGIDYRQEFINSNVIGYATGDSVEAKFENDGFYTKEYDRNILNVFANHSIVFKSITFSAGIQTFSNTKIKSIFSPGADIIWKAAKNVQFGVSFNKAVRIPTFTDLFYNGPVNIGNPDLKPEHSTNYEFNIHYNKDKSFNVNASVFYRQGKDLIDWARRYDTLPWQSLNLTFLDTYGTEIAIYLNPLLFGENNKFIKGLWFDYSFITSDKKSGEWISYYVMDYLKHKAVLKMENQIIKNLSVLWILNYQDRAGSFTDFNSNQEKEYKAFYTINSRFKYVYKYFDFYCDINNLTDVEYIDFGNIYQPGIWIKLGLTANIPIAQHK